MTIQEIVLIITIGYSPSGASGVGMKVLEYVQPSLQVCNAQKLSLKQKSRFDFDAICVIRDKNPRGER